MQTRYLVIVLTLIASLALLCSPALADEEKPVEKEPLSGKELFKNHCKICHGPEAEAEEYTPMSLIQEQWEEFFDELWVETHGEVVCPEDSKKKVTDMWDAEMLKAVRKFCVDHAADSEQPMTCG